MVADSRWMTGISAKTWQLEQKKPMVKHGRHTQDIVLLLALIIFIALSA